MQLINNLTYLCVCVFVCVCLCVCVGPFVFCPDVPSWLKSLRLHKYAALFSTMTYDEMMSLTEEQLEAQVRKHTNQQTNFIVCFLSVWKKRITTGPSCYITLSILFTVKWPNDSVNIIKN